MKPLHILVLGILFAVSLVTSAAAAQNIRPGFRSLGVWNSEENINLELAIWYPTTRGTNKIDKGDWIFQSANNAPPLSGRHPLILLSHDSPGSRFSLHSLATALARNGFVIAAITHAGDNIDDMRLLYTGRQLTTRVKQLKFALDILLSNTATEPMIDAQHIGMMGIGPGGTAALMLAGARPETKTWGSFCTEAPESIYCTPWVKNRMDEFVVDENFIAKDNRINAVCAVAPAYGMFLTPTAMEEITIPILYIQADKSQLCPPKLSQTIMAALTSNRKTALEFVSLPDADTVTLTSPCGSDILTETFPELCRPRPERDEVQKILASKAEKFFAATLGKKGRRH